jgi:hypothetical protein
MLKRILKKLRKKEEEYPNRFLKFYHQNKKKLNKGRRLSYSERKKQGICVRCKRKAISKIVFCEYHQQKQIRYNKKARSS